MLFKLRIGFTIIPQLNITLTAVFRAVFKVKGKFFSVITDFTYYGSTGLAAIFTIICIRRAIVIFLMLICRQSV